LLFFPSHFRDATLRGDRLFVSAIFFNDTLGGLVSLPSTRYPVQTRVVVCDQRTRLLWWLLDI